MKRKLFVDMDNTYFNTIEQIVNMYNSDYRYYERFRNIDWHDIKSWHFEGCKLLEKNDIGKYFTQHRFFKEIKPMPYAEEALLKLSNYYDTVFVSMGSKPNLKGKAEYVSKLPFKSEFIGCNQDTYPDKSHVDMREAIFIDDMVPYLETSNAEIKICYGEQYTWNKDWKGIWYSDWREIEKYLFECLRDEK